jgi:hypothetical protein
MEMASLTVKRTSAADAGHRQIVVTLDGEAWVTLLNGQTATREVSPGRHVLKADNTLHKRSLDVEIGPGEQATFNVANRPGPGMWLFMLLGSPLLRLTLEREGETATKRA